MIQQLLILLFGLLFGTRPTNDLHKKVGLKEQIEAYLIRYAHIIVPILFLMMIILFVILCYALVGVSAVESGVQYNHFQDVI